MADGGEKSESTERGAGHLELSQGCASTVLVGVGLGSCTGFNLHSSTCILSPRLPFFVAGDEVAGGVHGNGEEVAQLIVQCTGLLKHTVGVGSSISMPS